MLELENKWKEFGLQIHQQIQNWNKILTVLTINVLLLSAGSKNREKNVKSKSPLFWNKTWVPPRISRRFVDLNAYHQLEWKKKWHEDELDRKCHLACLTKYSQNRLTWNRREGPLPAQTVFCLLLSLHFEGLYKQFLNVLVCKALTVGRAWVTVAKLSVKITVLDNAIYSIYLQQKHNTIQIITT